METLTGIILENLDAALGKYALCLEAPAKQRKTREELGQKIVCKRQEQARLRDHARGLYESLTLGEIDKDDYFSLRERYDSRLAQITEDLQQLEKGLAAIDAQIKEAQKLRHDAESIRKDRALTAELIDRLIERITVTPEKQITVQMKFQSEYDSYGEVLEKCRAM